jgi:oligoendopeptidase F
MTMAALPEPRAHQLTPNEPAKSWSVIEPVLERLAERDVSSRAALEALLRDWDEFKAWTGEEVASSQVAAARFTDDDDVQSHYMTMVREVIPKLTQWDERIGRKIVESPAAPALEGTDFAPYLKQVRRELEIFREENIPLQQKLNELINDYNKISGAWTVEFAGETRTMSGMARFLADADREVREAAWRAVSDRRLADADALEDLFDEMFAVRVQIAANAGFDNYRDYIFAEKQRDYSPDDCVAYHEVVEAAVVPLQREISAWVAERLGNDTYRPWDSAADPDGGSPLAPFEKVEDLKGGVERMMRRVDPELGEQFAQMREWMDLESRPSKSQGGFMMTLPWSRRPFIFSNASGSQRDVITLLHEAGHAFHFVAAEPRNPVSGTHTPMEFNEVASMAMELLHYDTLDEFYDDTDQRRAIVEHLRRLPRVLTSVARGDAFQHWMYTNPDHTREERRAKWVELGERFGDGADRSGIEPERFELDWHGILHFFVVPFYFIEYGFAQLGALQVALNAEADWDDALDRYKGALALGPQRDVFGLYDAAGASFVPTAERVSELADWIRNRLFA